MRNIMEVTDGDITKLAVDAIVNAANEYLLGGGGVDGAIHAAAGLELQAECRLIGGCPTGEARITKAYRLPARYVIHTVGPIWHGGDRDEDRLLESCYRNSLALAREAGVKTISFPAISTGVYHFPLVRAARIAVGTVADELARDRGTVEKVIFCTFGAEATDSTRTALAGLVE
jgi:O-acetyl-ADP-ribose deacetylase (regulator of RNase III)